MNIRMEQMIILALVVCVLAAQTAVAVHASQIGPMTQVFSGAWWPSACYNAHSDQYMAFWVYIFGADNQRQLRWRRIDANTGTLLGAEGIGYSVMSSYKAAPVYNPADHEWFFAYPNMVDDVTDETDIIAQRIGSDGTQIGGYIDIYSGHPAHQADPDTAYDSNNNRYMVAWDESSTIRGRIFDQYGTPVTSAMTLNDSTQYSRGAPCIAYNPVVNEYLIVWTDSRNWNGEGNNNSWQDIYGQRVNASTGALIGGNIPVYWGGSPYVPNGMDIPFEMVCSPTDGRYCLSIKTLSGSWRTRALIANPDGSLFGSVFEVASSGVPTGLVYCPMYNTYIFTYKSARESISAMRYTTSGSPIGNPEVVMTALDELTDSALAIRPTDAQCMQVSIRYEPTPRYLYAQRFAVSPLPVSALCVTSGGNSNALSWTNPNDPHFTGTKIVFKTTGFPTGPDDGTAVADKANAPGSADNCTHSDLTDGVTYYYAAFAHDAYPVYSASVTGSARPDGYPGTPIVTAPASGFATGTLTPAIQWLGETHDAYQVRMSQINDPNTSVNGWDSGVVTSAANNCTSGLLRDLSIYYVFVRLRNDTGWGNWSPSAHWLLTKTSADAGFWYPADAYPSSSGLSLYDSGVESGPGISSSILADGGSNVFKIIDSSTGRHCKAKYAVTNVSFDTGASVAVRMKSTGTIVNPGPNAGISNGGVGGMYIAVTTMDVRLVDKNGTVRGSYSLNGTAYHKYQLTVKNGIGGYNYLAQWRVYVDGVERINWTGEGTDDGFDGFMIGAGPFAATGTWWVDWAAGRADGAYPPSEWDVTNPEYNPTASPAVTDDGTLTPSLSRLHCSWNPVSGASGYRYCIGTVAGGSNVVGWTDVLTATEVDRTGLSLSEGQTYYFAVQANNGFGVWSDSGISNGIFTPAGVSIREAKATADTEVRAIRGMTVTGFLGGSFYIQDPLLRQGIRVVSIATVSAGQTVDVVGAMAGSGVERYIYALGNKVEVSDGVALEPIAMSNYALGGADLNALAGGVMGGAGANNLGLLVRCWGKVSDILGQTYRLWDKSRRPDGHYAYITVHCMDPASVPEHGTFAVVEGISTMDLGRDRALLVPAPE